MTGRQAYPGGRLRFLPHAWAVLLAVLILGPALGPGYVLTYDMVWVPDLAMRADFLGLGSGLPRAVPSDAVVAALDTVLPGMLLQKAMLVGVLVGAGVGALRLVGSGLAPRLVAVSLAVWNPYVIERLLLGQWTVLVGYAALPWLIDAAVRARTEHRVPARLPLLLPLASLSASAGIVSGLVVLAVGLAPSGGRAARRTAAWLVALVLAANAPWVVAGLLHASIAGTAGSARFFSLHGDGVPAPLAALSLGGIWNADVVPDTRNGVVLPLATCVLVVLVAIIGFRRTRRRLGSRTTAALVACWVIGFALAVTTWASPAAVDWLAGHAPGAGVLRDGTRYLALCVPLLVALAGDSVDAALDRGAEHGVGVLVAVAATVAPMVLLPDAAWGVGGQLRAVGYPDDWERAADALARAPGEGDVLVQPWGAYRRPEWNAGRTVLDPLGRYLPENYLADDRLSVSGTVMPGEDPRIPAAEAALAQPSPEAAARALGRTGVGVLAIELDAVDRDHPAPDVAGTVLYSGRTLRLVRVDGAVEVRDRPAGWVLSLALAWAAYVGSVLLGIGYAAAGLRRSRRPE